MPRDGSSIYTQPDPDVVADTTIESAKYNNFTNDVAQDLNLPRPIVSGGTGAANAHDAMIALSGEISQQVVTNYNSFPFAAGSFYSAPGATGAPNGINYFIGICYMVDANSIVLEARQLDSGANVKYSRLKVSGTWGAWALQPSSSADFVTVSGDTMTGSLTVNAEIVSNPSATSGAYYFGNGIVRYLLYDGTNFHLAGGPLIVDSVGIHAGGTITSAVAPTTGSYLFGTSSTKTLIYNGTDFIFSGGALAAGTGVLGRPGTGGSSTAFVHNLNWNGSAVNLWVDTTNVGAIAFTSDYRTKKGVTELPRMWDTVRELHPIRYTQAAYRQLFAADNVERWGFAAHELQATLTPSIATGHKDDPDTIQSLNPFPLIAALTKALQEAMDRIEALEAR